LSVYTEAAREAAYIGGAKKTGGPFGPPARETV
jgi:hypothetical protein